ncbi:alcohol dehydrogenase catalytic domain-containing protein [Pseudonocardia nigra]|uniref:alcohol dehydrogenase catalytic domain-containing protein n=1 Tax=Pseudonocardia nigra TaxID=1921578 RepID=UPI001C5FCE9D|nr:alcohol dehydrogenase catalytic domain-containing protein [Pseudonocardia nigra]
MRALVFGADRVPRVQRVPEPTPGSGEVLLRVEAAGICHTDHDILHGRYPAALPRVPGHEFAGEIVELGHDVTRWRVGDRVAVDPLVACDRCPNCRRGHRNLCREIAAYGADLDGGAAEFAVVRAQNAHAVGDLPGSVAALAEPLACATLGVRRANPRPEARALVLGAGPIGLLLAVALRSHGVRDIGICDLFEERLTRARAFGVSATYPAGPDLPQQLLADHGPEAGRFDLVIDATGRPEVVQQGLALLRDAGTLLVFGVCPPGSGVTVDPHEVYARQLTILGSFSLAGTLPEAITTLRTTSLPAADLVSHTFALDEAVDAFHRIGSPDTLKIQVTP